MASQTNDHASPFSMSRMFTREHVVQNAVAKTGNLDSSQLTHLKSAPKTLDRTNYSPSTPMDVKRAVHRVRSSGSVAPKKKNALTEVVFTLTYDKNGAGAPSSIRYRRGGEVIVKAIYSQLLNSMFIGWNTLPNGMGTFVDAGTHFFMTRDLTLYAVYQWRVIYDKGSPTASGEQVDETWYTTDSQAILLDLGTIINPGLTFTGWTNALLSPGTSVTVPYGGLVMRASWANVIYILDSITYELNSLVATGAQSGPGYATGATATVLNQGTMAKVGAIFKGWSTNYLATVPDYPVGFTFPFPVGGITLYAIWDPADPADY